MGLCLIHRQQATVALPTSTCDLQWQSNHHFPSSGKVGGARRSTRRYFLWKKTWKWHTSHPQIFHWRDLSHVARFNWRETGNWVVGLGSYIPGATQLPWKKSVAYPGQPHHIQRTPLFTSLENKVSLKSPPPSPLLGDFFWFPLSNCFVIEIISTAFWSPQPCCIFYLPTNFMVRIKLHSKNLIEGGRKLLQLDTYSDFNIYQYGKLYFCIYKYNKFHYFIIVPKLSSIPHERVVHCIPFSSHLQKLCKGCAWLWYRNQVCHRTFSG